MPVFKIRYRDSHDMPMRGEDIVAFELNAQNHIQRVIVGEAKADVLLRVRPEEGPARFDLLQISGKLIGQYQMGSATTMLDWLAASHAIVSVVEALETSTDDEPFLTVASRRLA